MAKSKKSSLRTYVARNYLALLIIFVLLILDVALFVVNFLIFKNNIITYASAGVFVLLIIAIIVLYIYFSEKSYKLFYQTLYQNSIKNLQALKDNSTETNNINDSSMKEFDEMNEIFNDIHSQYKGRIVTTAEVNFDNIPFEYESEEKNLLTYNSLADNIVELIIRSRSFRNALIEFYYDPKDQLAENEVIKLLEEIRRVLDYKNLLVAKNKNGSGLLVYIPVFDNVNQLEEELASIFKHTSIVRRTSEGKKIFPARIAAVVYPYSAPDQMINDLGIAKRSDKPINIYMPSKDNKENDSLLFESYNVNQLAKISERLDLLDSSSVNGKKEIEKALTEMCNYFSFDNVGFADFNKVKKQYLCNFSYSANEKHLILKDKSLSNKFVEKLMLHKDNDSSYYFSSRKHVNDSLASFVDAHELKSGLFYLVVKDNAVASVIYFVNYDKELEYSTMIRTGLISICNKIGNYLKSINDSHIANINAKRFKEILKLNNDILYSVNPDDYSLFFLSDALKSLVPKANEGDKCYKALYGNDSPCKECPLKTKKHMVEILKRRKFETTVVLHSSDDKAEHLYLKPMERNKNTSDLFSPDFLINSYYSLCSTLDDEFALNQEGEVLFLNVDNVASLIKALGNDGYIKVMRDLFDRIKDELELNYTIYLYKNDNFALVLPVSERKDIIAMVESIYSFSKGIEAGKKTVDININYFDFKYPAGSASSRDWITHVEKVMTGLRRAKKSDFIYFNEDKYVRSASREAFMLNNVLEAFNKKKYFMEYQPIVGNKDRTIHGVELLLRLTDPFTNQPLNIGESINILSNNNRLDLVSKAVRDCFDELFKKSDLAFFKSMGLEHMSLNMDYVTLSDSSFLDGFADLLKKHNIPKDFMCFEVPERDIMEHFDQFRDLKIDNASLVCDQYRGDLLSLSQLKSIHFNEVKISRDVILNVINDDIALQRALDIWKEAASDNMWVTFVGVEKRQQADLLHDDTLDSGFQGRFFYSPMDEEKLFKTLRENSIKEIADLDN